MQARRKHRVLASGRGFGGDASSVSLQTILRQARKSGQLNLSNRSFTEGSVCFEIGVGQTCSQVLTVRVQVQVLASQVQVQVLNRRVQVQVRPVRAPGL